MASACRPGSSAARGSRSCSPATCRATRIPTSRPSTACVCPRTCWCVATASWCSSCPCTFAPGTPTSPPTRDVMHATIFTSASSSKVPTRFRTRRRSTRPARAPSARCSPPIPACRRRASRDTARSRRDARPIRDRPSTGRPCAPGSADSPGSPMSSTRFQSRELRAALEAAKAAGEVIAPLYRSNVAVELKFDRSPVTEADRRAEQVIREVLLKHFPDHGFHGEEGGRSGMDAENIWLVDPLDGTKSFVRDTPFFSTQIALMRRGQFVLGVSAAGIYGETAWAERGRGAFLNGDPVRVSGVARLDEAILSAGNIRTLAAGPHWASYGALLQKVNRVRGY